MLSNRFRLQVFARVALIIGAALGLAYLIGWTRLYEAMLLVGVLLVFFVVRLVRYVEKTTRDLTRFLQAIRYADFSQGFVSGQRGPAFDELAEAFAEVVAEFKRLRAEKEEQVRYLQNVVQHVGIALVAFRTDGRIALMNTSARRLLDVGQARHLDALEAFSAPLVQVMRALGSGEQALVKVEQAGRTLQLAVYATRFRLGEAAYALVSIQDIGRELEEKEMQAWQELTGVLTHEITNSVAPISSLAATAGRLLERQEQASGSSGAAPDGAAPDGAAPDGAAPDGAAGARADTREALEVIQRRSEALVHFVEAYRSFTKIPAPDFQMLPVRELFARVRRLLSVQAQSAQVQVEVEPPSLQLTADPDLVEQVLINLALNAVQAVEGQPEAFVALRAHADRRGMPVLEVADNGSGIPADVQEKIFVPFFTTKADGSGIGLSLSRQIMRLHGGTLRVQSAPGEGATFTLRF